MVFESHEAYQGVSNKEGDEKKILWKCHKTEALRVITVKIFQRKAIQ